MTAATSTTSYPAIAIAGATGEVRPPRRGAADSAPRLVVPGHAISRSRTGPTAAWRLRLRRRSTRCAMRWTASRPTLFLIPAAESADRVDRHARRGRRRGRRGRVADPLVCRLSRRCGPTQHVHGFAPRDHYRPRSAPRGGAALDVPRMASSSTVLPRRALVTSAIAARPATAGCRRPARRRRRAAAVVLQGGLGRLRRPHWSCDVLSWRRPRISSWVAGGSKLWS